MDMVMYGLLIVIALSLILMWYISTYNRFQDYIIRINEAESNIDTTLRKRFDLLDKAVGVIKGNIENEEIEVLTIIEKLRSRKLTNFDLDRILYQAINEFDSYKEKYPTLSTNENFIKIGHGIHESEAEIMAYRKYYNDIITDYNRLNKTFPSIIVAMISHYKAKPYYDGKNMTDEKIDDFKL